MIDPVSQNPTARELVDTVNEVIAEVNAGGIPEAPIDGQQYGRKDAGWVVVAGLDSTGEVQSIQAGIGIVVDDTDPANPFVSAIPYVLPQATNAVLGGIRLGENLIYDSESGLVNVTIPPVSVQSVNGKTGDVVLDSADVGADPAGSAATAVNAHLVDADPHPQYTTVAEAAAAAPVQSVNGMTGAVTLESGGASKRQFNILYLKV